MQDAGDEARGALPPVGAEACTEMADGVKVELAGDLEKKGALLAVEHMHAFVGSFKIEAECMPDAVRVWRGEREADVKG